MALDELAHDELVEPAIEKKPLVVSPAQFNLFTGLAELIPIEVPEPAEDGREIRVDEGISLVKSEDGSQLIFSGFGLFLSKKSERLIAPLAATTPARPTANPTRVSGRDGVIVHPGGAAAWRPGAHVHR